MKVKNWIKELEKQREDIKRLAIEVRKLKYPLGYILKDVYSCDPYRALVTKYGKIDISLTHYRTLEVGKVIFIFAKEFDYMGMQKNDGSIIRLPFNEKLYKQSEPVIILF